jgi:hypothetical protein
VPTPETQPRHLHRFAGLFVSLFWSIFGSTMTTPAKLLDRAKDVMRESKTIDFKREFDSASAGAWCELIKDIVAFANSGGGVIVFGVENDGSNSNANPTSLLTHDTADITNRISKYTNFQFSEFEIMEVERAAKTRVALIISAADVPIVFTKPGSYDIGAGKQKTAFSQGTVYFRHGSKSEPGSRDDLLNWRDREISKARKNWLGGIRKVVQSPPGETVTVLSSAKSPQRDGSVVHARITSGPSAVSVTPANAGEIWPHRQVDLVHEVNNRLRNQVTINSYDIQCINKKLDVLKAYSEFAYKSHKHAAPQYSNEYADWIVEQFRKDRNFFQKTRAQFRPH